MQFDRRDFLKILGLGTAGTAVSGCTLQGVGTALQLTEQEIRPEPGPESWVASTCGLCSGGCGVLVRKIGERAVKVEGNPIHPVNRGRLCPVGQASLQLLYNPDRLRSPLKRIGERGSAKWQKISWEEAITLMVSRLKEIRDRGEPQTLVVLSDKESELANRLMQRFLEAYGSPNFVHVERENSSLLAHYRMQGVRGQIAYDLENANYILSFAAPLVEGWMSPVRQMRALAYLHQGRPGHRGKFVQIESRLSATAAKADEWVPVRPGTEGFLALGIAYILIKEGLYDHAFAERYLYGFEDLKVMVLKKYPPQKVSEMSGVSAERIERLGHEFAHYRPSLALSGDGLVQYANGSFSSVAVHALNALVGNIDKPGGILVRQDPPLASWPSMKQDKLGFDGLRQRPLKLSTISDLSDIVLREKPYKVNALFVLGANPLFSAPATFREALRKVPFVVSFSLFLDETVEQADLVLPDCTLFERWDLQTAIPGFALTAVGVGQPALAPLYESKPAADVVLQLAKVLGGNIASSFPWKESQEALKALVLGLYRSRRGLVFSSEFKDEHLQAAFREWKWAAKDYPTYEDFWKDLIEKGGWVDPYYKYGDYGRTLRAPSGKFQLPSLPSEEIVQGDENYPLHLYLFKPLAFMNDAGANLPFLQEISGSSVHSPWNSWMEINPQTARKLGIKDGDWVVIESPRHKVKSRARLFPGTMPDVVNMSLGQGHTALGRWAKDRGINPLSLVDGKGPTRVRVYKA